MSGMTLSIKEQWQKPRRAPKNAFTAAMLVVRQRRRRPLGIDGRQRVAFEEVPKEMLKYLEKSEELKVGDCWRAKTKERRLSEAKSLKMPIFTCTHTAMETP